MIRFLSYPRTEPPPDFVSEIVNVFRNHEETVSTLELEKGLTSDAALAVIRDDLIALGFSIEHSKLSTDKIRRPVYFGENGIPSLAYEIDGFHPEWRCGIEIEAGRGWMGNAVYRDLIQALIMVNVDHLVLAVANSYKYMSSGRPTVSMDSTTQSPLPMRSRSLSNQDALRPNGRWLLS